MQWPSGWHTGDNMSIVEFIRSIWEANDVVAGRIVRNGHAKVVDLVFGVWILFAFLCVCVYLIGTTYSSIGHYEWMRCMIDNTHIFAHIQFPHRFQCFRINSNKKTVHNAHGWRIQRQIYNQQIPVNYRALGECVEFISHWINRYICVVCLGIICENTWNSLENRMAWIGHYTCSVWVHNNTVSSQVLVVWIAPNKTALVGHYSVLNVEPILIMDTPSVVRIWTIWTDSATRIRTCEATPNCRTDVQTASRWLSYCPVHCATDSHSTMPE